MDEQLALSAVEELTIPPRPEGFTLNTFSLTNCFPYLSFEGIYNSLRHSPGYRSITVLLYIELYLDFTSISVYKDMTNYMMKDSDSQVVRLTELFETNGLDTWATQTVHFNDFTTWPTWQLGTEIKSNHSRSHNHTTNTTLSLDNRLNIRWQNLHFKSNRTTCYVFFVWNLDWKAIFELVLVLYF